MEKEEEEKKKSTVIVLALKTTFVHILSSPVYFREVSFKIIIWHYNYDSFDDTWFDLIRPRELFLRTRKYLGESI